MPIHPVDSLVIDPQPFATEQDTEPTVPKASLLLGQSSELLSQRNAFLTAYRLPDIYNWIAQSRSACTPVARST